MLLYYVDSYSFTSEYFMWLALVEMVIAIQDVKTNQNGWLLEIIYSKCKRAFSLVTQWIFLHGINNPRVSNHLIDSIIFHGQ